MAETAPTPACSLPSDKVFSIQIGSDIFRLSGASIASDAPSYFSQFFEEQLRVNPASTTRTLYIDRDPDTFKEIARHLQGYHVRPQDGAQFVKLFADAQFYSLPRLMSQLFESEIFIQIGDRHFQIPRDIFSSPGDSPNFFTLGFGAFFASPSEVFPGLSRQGLLRPPAIVPPSVPNRSADVFAELLHILRGYPLHIRNEEHRAELLRDCRYFHLRGVEQKLIPHQIRENGFTSPEIVIRVEDVRPSGIHLPGDPKERFWGGGIKYARPFVDENPSELILEIGGESTIINCEASQANFTGEMRSRMRSLLELVGKKLGKKLINRAQFQDGPIPIDIHMGHDTDFTINGETGHRLGALGLKDMNQEEDKAPPAKRRRIYINDGDPWIVRKGLWRLVVRSADRPGAYTNVLEAVKLDLWTCKLARNQTVEFL